MLSGSLAQGLLSFLPMFLRFSAALAVFALMAGPAWALCSKNLVERPGLGLGPGTQVASLDGLQFARGGSED